MTRALASLLILGCGGSKHAPPPAALPPLVSPSPLDAGVPDAAAPPDGPTVAKGGDPQDGGEIAKAGGGSGTTTLAMRDRSPTPTAGAGVGAIGGAKPGPRPTVSIGKLSIFGSLDAAAATAVVKKFHGRFLYCYETALLKDPKLAGTVTLELAVETDGKVSSATAAGVDRDVDECLRHGALTIAFPAGKKTAKVSVPLAFQPPP